MVAVSLGSPERRADAGGSRPVTAGLRTSPRPRASCTTATMPRLSTSFMSNAGSVANRPQVAPRIISGPPSRSCRALVSRRMADIEREGACRLPTNGRDDRLTLPSDVDQDVRRPARGRVALPSSPFPSLFPTWPRCIAIAEQAHACADERLQATERIDGLPCSESDRRVVAARPTRRSRAARVVCDNAPGPRRGPSFSMSI